MEKHRIRKSAVAGQFYPSSEKDLKAQIESFIDKKANKADAIACVLPHAGYVYSGRVAVETLLRVNIKDKIILLGPNHTGCGEPFSIMAEGSWQTPLGEVKIDSVLTAQLLSQCEYLKDDASAHLYEHSLEVELPILQYFKSDFKIAPIVIMSQGLKDLKGLGESIAQVVHNLGLEKSVMIVASSDMTHYEARSEAARKDKEAIGAILELDPDKLASKIEQLNISMCGWAPVAVMLSAAKGLGASKAELIKYQTSGDLTGETTSVVGYAGIIIR